MHSQIIHAVGGFASHEQVNQRVETGGTEADGSHAALPFPFRFRPAIRWLPVGLELCLVVGHYQSHQTAKQTQGTQIGQ